MLGNVEDVKMGKFITCDSLSLHDIHPSICQFTFMLRTARHVPSRIRLFGFYSLDENLFFFSRKIIENGWNLD